jgi:voltage-gated potassium channel
VTEVSDLRASSAEPFGRHDVALARHAVRALLRSALVSILLVVLYFALPLTGELGTPAGLLLIGGMVGFTALLVWHLHSIVNSPYPRARAVAALTTTMTVFVVLFSTVYLLMSRSDPDSFSEPLSRLDAAYFTITVFSTVGFGDIAPLLPAARAATTAQMLGDVVLVGIVARLVIGAMRRGLENRGDPTARSDSDKETPDNSGI